MSGHKRTTITLSRDELRRLQEASKRLSEVDREFHKLQDQMAQYRAQNFSESVQSIEARQEAFNQSLQGVTSQLAFIEYNTSQTVIAQAVSLQDELARLGSDVWENTFSIIDDHAQRMETAFVESEAARQEQFQRLQRSLSVIKRSNQDKATYAAQAVQESQRVLDTLSSLYGTVEGIQPEIVQAEQRLNQAVENLHAGFHEAALISAQESFSHLSHLRLQAEAQIQQNQILNQMMIEKMAYVQEALTKNRTVHAVNTQGEILDALIDVDFWSNGGWRNLMRRFKLIRDQINHTTDFRPDEIARLQEELTDIQDQVTQVVFDARLAVISSQVRFNIAECVVSALQEQGFSLETSKYDLNDMRNPYTVQLENFEGSQVTVHLNPHPQDPIAHDVDIEFQDIEIRSEHEMRQRAGEISTTLNSFGLQVNAMEGIPLKSLENGYQPQRLARRVQEVRERYGDN